MFVLLFANDNGDATSPHLPFWFGISFFVVTFIKLFRMNLSFRNNFLPSFLLFKENGRERDSNVTL